MPEQDWAVQEKPEGWSNEDWAAANGATDGGEDDHYEGDPNCACGCQEP